MSYTIGEVEVRFGAKIDRFESQMNKVSKKLEGIGSAAKRMFGMLAGAFAVGKIVSFSDQIMKAADANAKHAKAMGASLEGLIGLQHAAALSGASVEDLDKSLIKMNQNLGTGKAAGTLKDLGLSSTALQGMSADQKFLEIADAIGKIEDPTKRTALAMEMFGKGGVKLISMTLEGKGSIRAMAQEAADLGITLNEVRAAKFEKVNDNFDRISASIKGAAQTMLIELAPAIDKIAEKAVNVGKAFNNWLQGGTKSEADRVDEWGDYYKRLEDLQGRLSRGEITKEEFGALDAQNRARRQEVTQGKAPGFGDMFAKMEEELSERADALNEKFAQPDFAMERNKLAGMYEEGRIGQDVYQAALEELNKKDPAEALRKEMEKADEEVKRRAESIAASVATPLEVFQDKMKEIAELEASGALSGEMAQRARQKAWADAGGFGEAPGADSMGPDGKPLGTNTRGIAGGDVGALIAQQTLQKGAEDRQAAIQRLNEQQKTLLERIEANTRTPQGAWA